MIWLALTVMVLFGLGGIGAFVYGTVLTRRGRPTLELAEQPKDDTGTVRMIDPTTGHTGPWNKTQRDRLETDDDNTD